MFPLLLVQLFLLAQFAFIIFAAAVAVADVAGFFSDVGRVL